MSRGIATGSVGAAGARAVTAVGMVAIVLGLTWTSVTEAATVKARVRRDPKIPAGVDSEGRLLLFTPDPVQPGSSHSHWDISASPNLLMEPNNSADLPAFDLDLTPQAMQDLGWPLGASTLQVSFTDPAGEGFDDPDLGEARRDALEAAAQTWGSVLGSSVTIRVEASFDALQCDDDGATLARAGPRFAFMDFGAGLPDTWYAGALAESLSGEDLSAEDDSTSGADLAITFNSAIDEECIREGSGFYYGLDDDRPSGSVSFLTVALHELGHGLGFLGLLNEETGIYFRGAPDIFTRLTYDQKTDKFWDEMTAAQRLKSIERTRQVSFDGENAAQRAEQLLEGSVVIRIKSPKKIAGDYEVGTATFGPSITKKGIRGKLVLVDDGSDQPTFGCQPLVNGEEVRGKIAVIDRGDCLFVIKTKNAQDAGARGVIIVHNESGFPPDLGGSDDSIEIPAVRIGKRDGKKIKRQIRK